MEVLHVQVDPLEDEKIVNVDYSTIKAPTWNPYLISLKPSLPTNSKAPAPPATGLQIGNLISTTAASPKDADWSDTNFVVLLDPFDTSLWIAFNYTPYDDLGKRGPEPNFSAVDPRTPFGGSFSGLPDETPFDVAMLLGGDGVRKWDPVHVMSADFIVQNIVATRSTRGLAAKVAEPEDIVAAQLEGAKVQPLPSTAGRSEAEIKQ